MQSRTFARELALLVLSQIPEKDNKEFKAKDIEIFLHKVLDTLVQHWRDNLDEYAIKLDNANQQLIESELEDLDKSSLVRIKANLQECISKAEYILNSLSASIELPRLLVLSDQERLRVDAIERVSLVIKNKKTIDSTLDSVMEGWRLKRLPRIDRDILRLAVVDLLNLKTPVAVTCNEAVELANRYSDEQGRKMINGVLRRLQNFLLQSNH